MKTRKRRRKSRRKRPTRKLPRHRCHYRKLIELIKDTYQQFYIHTEVFGGEEGRLLGYLLGAMSKSDRRKRGGGFVIEKVDLHDEDEEELLGNLLGKDHPAWGFINTEKIRRATVLLRCSTCLEQVAEEDTREHLSLHHLGAQAFETGEVRDCFEEIHP